MNFMMKCDYGQRNCLKLSSLILVAAWLTSCKTSETEKKALDQVFDPPPEVVVVDESDEDNVCVDSVEESEPTNGSVDGGSSCYQQTFYQPQAEETTKKVDVLFVTDTSGSLREERPSIAREIGAFVDELPQDVDYQMAVMLAHGSRGSGSGKLWKYKNDRHVLASSEMSFDEIRDQLVYKLTNVRTDSHSDGGEEGLYSLNRALDHGMLTAARAHGFFRPDAALAVIFIADENDICARYPDGVTPEPDPQGKEGPAFERDCGNILAESLYGRLKELQGDRPLMIAGILYNENSVIPQGGENEIGYGYLDLIRLAQGISIDLSGQRFHEGLEAIGALVNKKLTLRSRFPIEYSNIDSINMSVKVDGVEVPFEYLAETNEVHLTDDLGKEGSEILITYCVKVEQILDPPVSSDDSAGGSVGDEPADTTVGDGGAGGSTTDPVLEDPPPPTSDSGGTSPTVGTEPNDVPFQEPVDEDGDGIDDYTGEVLL